MILEMVDIRIRPGEQVVFDAAIRRGVETVIANATGFRGYKVNRGVESPDRYVLMIFWDALEDHTVGFRGSLEYQRWRGLLHSFYDPFPVVEHFAPVATAGAAG